MEPFHGMLEEQYAGKWVNTTDHTKFDIGDIVRVRWADHGECIVVGYRMYKPTNSVEPTESVTYILDLRGHIHRSRTADLVKRNDSGVTPDDFDNWQAWIRPDDWKPPVNAPDPAAEMRMHRFLKKYGFESVGEPREVPHIRSYPYLNEWHEGKNKRNYKIEILSLCPHIEQYFKLIESGAHTADVMKEGFKELGGIPLLRAEYVERAATKNQDLMHKLVYTTALGNYAWPHRWAKLPNLRRNIHRDPIWDGIAKYQMATGADKGRGSMLLDI